MNLLRFKVISDLLDGRLPLCLRLAVVGPCRCLVSNVCPLEHPPLSLFVPRRERASERVSNLSVWAISGSATYALSAREACVSVVVCVCLCSM